MRGLTVPQQKGAVDWPFAQEHLRELNGHKFIEALIMGRKRKVYAHVIIPTSCSILMDEARHKAMAAAILRQNHHKILLKQDSVTTCCAMCCGQVLTAERKPYQMAIRLIGAIEPDCTTWSYDVVIGILCRTCETRPWRSLMTVKETDFVAIADCIERYGFREPLSVEQFMDDDCYGPNQFLVSSMALVESYVYRMDNVNAFTSEAMKYMQTDAEDASVCYHCNRASHVDLMECPDCKTVSFCTLPSIDKRMGNSGLSCFELSQIYHAPLCLEIKRNRLFHTECAVYVERKDKFECVPCFAPEEEEDEEE